jgi:hypothetical protein
MAHRRKSWRLQGTAASPGTGDGRPGGAVQPGPVPRRRRSPRAPIPSLFRYAGREDVRGKTSLEVEIIRFGEGYPAFAPSILIGSPGQSLSLTLVNKTPVAHNFSTLDRKVDRDIRAGKSVTVSVQFPQAAGLIFYCKFHLVDFQVGELKVGS